MHGFYPDVKNRALDPVSYYRDYFETYVQRDLRQMMQVNDLRLFRKFVRLCAGRIGQNFNASEIANTLGVSSHTIKSSATFTKDFLKGLIYVKKIFRMR